MPAAGELSSRELTWTWDANSDHLISFILQMRADERGGVVTTTELVWEVLAGG
jgi:hypothetical protein